MLILLITLSLLPASVENKLTPELAAQIEEASPDEFISCIVIMKEKYPYHEMRNNTVHEKIVTYQRIARESQSPLIDYLENRNGAEVHQKFWVMNSFHLKAIPQVIVDIATREDVGLIYHNGTVHAIPVEPSLNPEPTSRAIEWGVQKIMADSCWNAGYTGSGVILGMCDTGVDYEHPALEGKWTGYWHDAINGQTTPYDDHYHGTHCMGTILGGDGFGSFTEDIGVAPGATYVAAKMLDESGSGTYAQCEEGLQFMADLKDSVDIKAVSNSWGGSNAADTFFYPVMRTYISIDLLPIVANGNNGSEPGCPGSYSNVIGVGATDSNDDIASFSNPGPAPDQHPFNDESTWLRADWNLIKPQISAPGVNVRSAEPGGGYQELNGTSMATPHVAGAVGLICSKNPTLTPKTLYSILLDNVDEPSQGSPYPNNDYGWGRLNAWKSVQATPTTDQPFISILDKTMDDINPGETGNLVITLKNVGGKMAYNTIASLESDDNYLTIGNNFHDFGDLDTNETGTNSGNPFEYTAHDLTPEGYVASMTLIIHADGEDDSLDFDDTVNYSLQIGTPPAPLVIYEEDFEYGGGIDSFPDYWNTTGNWQRTTDDYNSPTHSAYSGAVSDNATYLTLKNSIDLSAFSSPQLALYHDYDFDSGIFMDEASINISTDGGSSWSDIWIYDWTSGDTSPWSEEIFDLSSNVSDNVKIRFTIDGYTFFQDYTDWYVDDIKIQVPTDNKPPYFENTTVWKDTLFTGPFPVESYVSDRSGINSVYLYYRVNSGSWQNIQMTLQKDGTYSATIPEQSTNDIIDYYLEAEDTWITPNVGTDPVGAPGYGYYSFQIKASGIDDITGGINFKSLSPNPSRGDVKFRFATPAEMKVSLNIYDVMGRNIRTLIDKKVKGGLHDIVWNRKDDNNNRIASGIYFIKFKAGKNYSATRKLVLMQ